MAPPKVTIIGGGLAGMTVAKELAERQVPVMIVEASARLGGKAGADPVRDAIVEHGYHVFPGWYLNTRRLLHDLGIAANLIDIEAFYHLKKKEFPRFIAFHTPSNLTNIWKNITSGLVPLPEALLAVYFGLDLASQPFRHRGYLDRVSANGFLWSRFYATERLAVLHQQTVLQTSAIPNYEVAAMTIQKLFLGGFGTPAPIFSVLNGNLQEKFIAPFERFLKDHGVVVKLNQRVRRIVLNDHQRVSGLELDGGGTLKLSGSSDVVVLATPLEMSCRFADAEIVVAENGKPFPPDAEKCVADVAKLRAAQMAAMDIDLRRRIPNIPNGHVTLYESRYGLSFIDVSQRWPGMTHTKLCTISSDFAPLRDLPEKEIERYLLAELREYVPAIQEEDVERCSLHVNRSAPLFINSVGAWHNRPATKTRIDNLYITGDYCRSEADLATMESAISSAQSTVRDLLRDQGLGASDGPIPLAIPSRALLRLRKYAMLPVAGPIGLYYWSCRRVEHALRQVGLMR